MSNRIEPTGKDIGPKWYSYFLCGVKGVFDHFDADKQRQGLEVTLSGNVPPASGLSSSSALVSSAVLAVSYRHQVNSSGVHAIAKYKSLELSIYSAVFVEQETFVIDCSRMRTLYWHTGRRNGSGHSLLGSRW